MFTVGAVLPMLLVAPLSCALPVGESSLNHLAVKGIGMGPGTPYAITIAAGHHDNVVAEPYLISSARQRRRDLGGSVQAQRSTEPP